MAAAIMGIAVAGILGGLATAARNASKLTQMDRAALLAHVFDVDHHISRHFRGVYRELHHYNEATV